MSALFLILRRAAYSKRNGVYVSTSAIFHERLFNKDFKTENNLSYIEDPDTFGTLSSKLVKQNITEDEGDIIEEKYIQNIPLKSQKLTIKQYADIIKQYVKHKRLKEAFDILEVRMIKEDRVKPENYIYNILIGACADVGYTKKAFKLYNDMKRRALKPTGDTYTCLFESCIKSPWPKVGLKHATNLRNLMIEKGIEPNLTNYNVMIKTFGRCNDLPMAFKLVDEMISKKIKIRIHTLNHLLQACISDKESGLRHALIVWRKMLKLREKPNIYSFNLMLRCVKDCNLGTKEDIQELIHEIHSHKLVILKQLETGHKPTLDPDIIKQEGHKLLVSQINEGNSDTDKIYKNEDENHIISKSCVYSGDDSTNLSVVKSNVVLHGNEQCGISLDLCNKQIGSKKLIPLRTVPNLLSKELKMDQVLSLQEVHTSEDKFAIIGGQDDFLKEMAEYSVKPDIKTFTQILALLHNNVESENSLINTMQSLNIKPDIEFYNMLIKKRCFRHDYDSAFDVLELIEKWNKMQKRHPFNKKYKVEYNILTYGVLALACKTKEKAEQLLSQMKEKQLKINVEILGTLLQNAAFEMKFGYILYVMNLVKQENIKVNKVFIKHLEVFNDKCLNIIEKNVKEGRDSPVFKAAYQNFCFTYSNWLKEINIEEALNVEHPWKQFMEPHPETIQRDNVNIKQPKKFYKKNRKFIKYNPRI